MQNGRSLGAPGLLFLFYIDKIDTSVCNYNRHECRKNGDAKMLSKKERTRETILSVTYELFAREGFNKITMKGYLRSYRNEQRRTV